MQVGMMERRREFALGALQEIIDVLGPITDEAGGKIREPILEVIDEVYGTGEELKEIRFDVYEGTRSDDNDARNHQGDWPDVYNEGITILNIICDGEPWSEEKKERVEEHINDILDRAAEHLGGGYP